MDKESAISQIQKLRALAEGTHSRGEKEAAIAAASNIASKFQISEAELLVNNPNLVGEPIELADEHIIYESGRLVQWKSELAIGLASIYGCFILNSQVRGGTNHRKVNRYRLVGRKTDIDLALYFNQFIIKEIEVLVNMYEPAFSRGVSPKRLNFCLGAARGIIAKMESEKKIVLSQASSSAMVLVSNKAGEAEKAYTDKFGGLKRSLYSPQGQRVAGSYEMGFAQGQKIRLNSGLNQ